MVNVTLFKNVGMTSDFKHCVYFPNESARTFYFNNLKTSGNYLTLSNVNYERLTENTIRLNINNTLLNSLFSFSYMIVDSVYYFITDLKYINDNCIEFIVEIDVFTTFLNVTFEPCFVERQHSVTDNYGENLVNEPNLCDMQYDVEVRDDKGVSDFGNERYLLLAESDDSIAVGGVYSYIINKDDFIGYADMRNDYNSILDVYKGYFPTHTDRVIGIYKIASDLIKLNPQTPELPLKMFYGQDLACREPLDHLGGNYTPINKKCLQFPFQKVVIDNCRGSKMELKFEDLTNNELSISTYSDVPLHDTLYILPDTLISSDYVNPYITTNCLLEVPLVKTDLTDKKIYDTISKTISATGSAIATANPIPLLESTINNGFNVYDSGLIQSANVNNDSIKNYAPYFTVKIMVCTRQIANLYDRYFTKYGYAQNKVINPNIHARPCYTYLKTRDCCIKATIPQRYIQKMQDICNSGVTFWMYDKNVLDYSQNNKPL